VIDANLIPRFISFLSRADVPKLQFEAAWCLTNVASGDHEHVQVLLNKGTVDAFVRLLQSPHFEVIEQAIWGLGNLAGDNTRVRDIVIAAGAVDPIANLLDQTQNNPSFVRNASWTLANFCRGRPGPKFEQVARCIPSLARILMNHNSEEILTDICWAFSYISDGGKGHIPFILQTNVTPRIIELLEHNCLAISVASLRTIGNILTGDDNETQVAIDAGCLEAFNRLIVHNRKAVRKEVCWSVSNVTAGNSAQI
jgi:importin subunit alpha-6/7